MQYKVGDKVRVKKNLIVDEIYGNFDFVAPMEEYEGQIVTIISVRATCYEIEEDNGTWAWTEEMLEQICENDDNSEKIENDLMEVITAIVNNEKDKIKDKIESIVEVLKKENMFCNPEKFDLYVNSNTNKYLKTLLEEGLQQEQNSHNIVILYLNYSFLEENIRQLCKLKEGTCCCADKSRYILKMYLEYLKSDKIPVFNLNEEKYYKPNFGNNEDWIKFCESLIELAYGNPEEYIKQYNKLLQSEIRKYKHTKHSWHLKFKDGEDIMFDTSWDNSTKMPPICADKLLNNDEYKDYYALNKKHLKDRKYKEIGEGMFTICLIPKTDIEKIYKVSEELMV